MKMPVGEKKKRKDKDGEKVSKQNPKNFDHSGIQNLDELLFKSMKPEKSKQRFNILSQTYHALWPYYSVVFNTPKKTAELEVGPSFSSQSTMLYFQLFRSSTFSVDEIRNVEM